MLCAAFNSLNFGFVFLPKVINCKRMYHKWRLFKVSLMTREDHLGDKRIIANCLRHA